MHCCKIILAIVFFAIVLLSCDKEEPPFVMESIVYKMAGVHTWSGLLQISYDTVGSGYDSVCDITFSNTFYVLNDTTITCWDSLATTQDTFHLSRDGSSSKFISFRQTDYGAVSGGYLVYVNLGGNEINWDRWFQANNGWSYFLRINNVH